MIASSPQSTLALPISPGLLSSHSIANWEAILTAIDQLTRRVAREEYERLVAEQTSAAAEAIQNDIVDTVRTAAAILQVREQTVYEWIKEDKIKSYKVGRAVRLKRGDVLAALKAQTLPDGRRKYARRAGNQKGR